MQRQAPDQCTNTKYPVCECIYSQARLLNTSRGSADSPSSVCCPRIPGILSAALMIHGKVDFSVTFFLSFLAREARSQITQIVILSDKALIGRVR